MPTRIDTPSYSGTPSIPARVERKVAAGEPKRLAMSTSGKAMADPAVKVGK